jgi:ketosteroid isomerase-like protein
MRRAGRPGPVGATWPRQSIVYVFLLTGGALGNRWFDRRRRPHRLRTVASTLTRDQEDDMATMAMTPVDDATAQELSERLADVFRTGKASDVLTEDLFLDGHPPLWRFQLQGRDAFAAWLGGYAPAGAETTVVRTIPTATGFVTEFVGRHDEDGAEMTDRKILLCEVRGRRISELTVYCSGDWDAELRARHAAEAPIIRP